MLVKHYFEQTDMYSNNQNNYVCGSHPSTTEFILVSIFQAVYSYLEHNYISERVLEFNGLILDSSELIVE